MCFCEVYFIRTSCTCLDCFVCCDFSHATQVLRKFPSVSVWTKLVPGPKEDIPSCGKAILAPEGLKWPTELRPDMPLFIRGCYPKVFEMLLDFEHQIPCGSGVVLTGNPGIGKVSTDVSCVKLYGGFLLIYKPCVCVGV